MAGSGTGGVTTDTLSAPVMVFKTEAMEDRLSKSEIRKDALQETVQSVATTVGEVASIITTAVKDVAGAIGGLATDVFEIRDGVKRAEQRTDDTME